MLPFPTHWLHAFSLWMGGGNRRRSRLEPVPKNAGLDDSRSSTRLRKLGAFCRNKITPTSPHSSTPQALIMHSSGTTGCPEPMYHAQAYALLFATNHNLPEQQERFGRNVSRLPLYLVSVYSSSISPSADDIFKGFRTYGAVSLSERWNALLTT